MTSNYNEIHLSVSPDKCSFKEGDIFQAPEICSMRILKFNGLEVKRVSPNVQIGICFGTKLEFDYNDWESAIPVLPKRKKLLSQSSFIYFI
ncbi:hypothetical protein VB796_06640 [Arcicella sp. LKC2W]|uniref:hypothetical protein n=1 Tax=Arcicella sp. LKC2W TaxID=2984198 RepID=UPI002B1EE623|nr:hypothetical protein [Arcicella sp. LKC2W]MEA5458705.1 hypothetical protein [Arcicella sp. LKC2W]